VIVTAFLALTAVGKTGALYDGKAHRLQAHGAAAADLRAPSPQVARVKAERIARAQAEHRLADALDALGAELDDDALRKTLDQATIESERYGSDGSVELDLVLATKDLRLSRRP
jgi:hypothetical protein